MKIIASNKSGFLLEATTDELARLCGYYYHGVSGCPHFSVGSDIDINSMFMRLYGLAKSKEELSRLAKSLRSYADHRELHEPIINEIIEHEV